MTVTQIENMGEFRQRFYSFYDSVIRSLYVSYRPAGRTEVEIIISTRDSMSAGEDRWVNIRLTIKGVTEFALCHRDNVDYQVLSNGIHLKQIEKCYFLEFGDCIDEPADLEEIRRSKFYIAGAEIEYEITPYQE